MRRNTTPPFVPLPPLTPAVQELIAAANGVDQRLYDFAAERLSLRIAAGGDAFQQRLGNFRRLNGLFGRICRLLRPAS